MSHHFDDALAAMDTLRAAGEAFCLVTIVRTANATSAKAGAKAVVTRAGAVHGHIGGGCVTGAVKKAVAAAIDAGEPRLIRVRPKEEVVAPLDGDGVDLFGSSCPSGGTVDLFLEPMLRPARLVILGATPVARALAEIAQAARHTVVVAALPEDRDKLAGAPEVLDGLDPGPLGLTSRDAVVVATQGKRDREALAGALASGAGYVGMVGSRRKVAALTERLAADFPPERLAAVHGPIGLDIGAIEPEEIAIAILAEVIRLRRRG